ncbi:head-tail joining protein [Polaromonas naphthalenivorans]|uniref:Phage protein n=1 Tax=Polaromonas naphthalenivorans (strain CJ2) TaxID=365044 RepID=A1VPI1_POLNA|nr:hypothetical protein [Polaromonas naphthalenivorans]ABM37559.1 hypothetical protein Pnap_2251 [Polaromonas naphthalenivorans CJ2]
MSLAPFAALQARANRAVLSRLSNATASYLGGQPFGVLFERTPTEPFGEVLDASARTCSLDLALVPGIAAGGILVINGTNYRVSGGVEPDETGWVRLQVFPEA